MRRLAGRVRVLALVALVGAGCHQGRPVAGVDGAADGSRDDLTLPDREPVPDASWFASMCPHHCPSVTGSQICLSGWVVTLPTLSAYRAGVITNQQTRPITSVDNVVVNVYDPIAFITNPTGASPLGKGAPDKNGCFVIKSLTIPFAGFFDITVDDAPGTSKERWVFMATSITPEPGKNSVGLWIAGLSLQDAQGWSKELGFDPVDRGSMIMVFLDRLTGRAVQGIWPQLEGKLPPWPGYLHAFFDDDPSQPPYFQKSAIKTTKSGMLLIKKAPVKSFGGDKGSCNIESGLGGSTPGTLLVRPLDVEGC